MTGFFITATGTGIGKTLVTAALCHQLGEQGKAVQAIKPIISGVEDDKMAGTDTAILAEALGKPLTADTLNSISPFRYKAPLAPSMAAKLEGRTLEYDVLIETCTSALQNQGITLIEGVGGAFVPLDDTKLVSDWIADLNLPSLVVTGSYLGTISHTIATLDAMAQRNLSIQGLVACESAGNVPDFEETLAQLNRWTGIPIVGVPRLSGDKPWQNAPDLTSLLT